MPTRAIGRMKRESRLAARAGGTLCLVALGLPLVIAAKEIDHTASFSVVQIRVSPGPGRVSYGSGVVVAPGKVATNCHVTREARHILVAKGSIQASVTAQAAEPRLDLCVLHAPGIPLPPARLSASGKLKPDDKLYFFGYPRALGMAYSEGKVKALHPYRGGQVIETNTDFTLGASGGGIFDHVGHLVGLATFLTPRHAGSNFAIPADWIASVLKRKPQAVEPLVNALSFWEDKSAMPSFLKPPGR